MEVFDNYTIKNLLQQYIYFFEFLWYNSPGDIMIKIMFVCHGNICRSPMAEFIFKDLINKNNLSDKFYVCSSATSTEEIWNDKGNPVYPPAQRELSKHGISCYGKTAVQLKKDDYEKYDYFIGMDRANIRNMNIILGNDPSGKIYKLMSFAGKGDDVADPWYSGDFETTYNDILLGCRCFLEYLLG